MLRLNTVRAHFFVFSTIHVLFAILTLLIPSIPARGQAGRYFIFEPPRGLWLIPPNFSGKLYGPTTPTANWSVAQWNIPSPLPAFSNGQTSNAYAKVYFLGHNTYSLEQNGRHLPCRKTYPTGKKGVDEFDLFVSPNTPKTRNRPSALTRRDTHLSSFSHLFERVSVTIKSVALVAGDCPVTQAGFPMAIILKNDRHNQVLFYTVRLAVFRVSGGRLTTRMSRPYWYMKGRNVQMGHENQFGYADNISAYRQPPLLPGVGSTYKLDLLPRLKEIIRDGASYGLDQGLADWKIVGAYHGQNIWGHIQAASEWQGYALAAQ